MIGLLVILIATQKYKMIIYPLLFLQSSLGVMRSKVNSDHSNGIFQKVDVGVSESNMKTKIGIGVLIQHQQGNCLASLAISMQLCF